MAIRKYRILKDAVTTRQILDRGIKTEDLNDDSVTRPKLKDLKYGTVSVTPGSIAGDSTLKVDVTVTGLVTTDKILVMIQGGGLGAVAIQGAEVSATDTLSIYYLNTSTTAFTPGSHTVLWMKLVP